MLLFLPFPTPPPDTTAARWYADAGAAYQHYGQPETVWGRGRQSIYTLLPVQLRLGYRFSDGVALELGLQYRWRRAPLTLLHTYAESPTYHFWQTTRAVSTFVVPLTCSAPVLRRRLAPTPWRLEARVGLAFLRTAFYWREYSTYGSSAVPFGADRGEQRKVLGDLPLVFGAQVRYGLNRHLELTAEANGSYSPALLLAVNFGSAASPVGGGAALGLRYRF